MGKVRLVIELDDETYTQLYHKYGSPKDVLINAAKQLASSDASNSLYSVLADIDRLLDLNEKVFQIERHALRIASALAERERMDMARIPGPFRRIVDDTLALRIQLLYDMIKKLAKAKVPLNYRKIIKDLRKDCYEFIKEWRRLKANDEREIYRSDEYNDYSDYG